MKTLIFIDEIAVVDCRIYDALKHKHKMTPDLEVTIRRWCAESEGWTSAERCLEMAQLILDSDPGVVVEIGVFGGRSFIPQALALKENRRHHGIVGKIYGIDAWKKDATVEGYEGDDANTKANRDWWLSLDIHQIAKLAAEAVWKFQVDEHSILIRAASQHCVDCIPSIDILFLDGNHSEIASTRDAVLYLPKVVKGGHVWLDDCDWDSTKQMQQFVAKSCKLVKESPDGHYKLFRKC